MIYDYSLSKILMFSYNETVLIDGTTQSINQRTYALRHYYRHDPKMSDFLHKCQVTLIENFPCNSRFELTQRIKLIEMICGMEDVEKKGKEIIVKKIRELGYKCNKAHKKDVFVEPVSNVLYLN